MKKIVAIAAASLLASASMIGTGAAQMNDSDEERLRLSQGASEFAPGQQQDEPGAASELAPGQAEGPAREEAPGQQMQALDDDEEIVTGATGQPNFGTVMSTLRTGELDISGVEAGAQANIVEIDELAPAGERQALDNAVAERQADIDSLHEALRDAELDGLEEGDIDRVVAAELEGDGSVTLYLR